MLQSMESQRVKNDLVTTTIYLWVVSKLFSSCSKQGLLSIVVQGLLIVVASLDEEHGF